ncbi:hypothetical protein [Halomicronema hongdechloris]|nr:hypothetical protein [Halomicronema hongdechloris]
METRFQYSMLQQCCGLLTSLLLLGLVACQSAQPPSSLRPITNGLDLDAVIAALDRALETGVDLTTVTVYRLDDQCQGYIDEAVRVPKEQALQTVIGQILSQQTFLGFDLSGYRVDYDPTAATITIDLRLAPDSFRRLVSLSSCEQQAIFGSLRQTLTRHPDWKIDTVQFTDRGQPLML